MAGKTESQATESKVAAPVGGGLAEVLAVLDAATPGPWEAKPQQEWDEGFDFFAGLEGAFTFPVDMLPEDCAAIGAAVNYLRSHGDALAELIEAATELRQRQRDYLADPKDQRQESKGRLVGIAADRLDAALAKVASNGDTK